MSSKRGPKPGSSHTHGKLKAINHQRRLASLEMGAVAYELICKKLTLEQIQAELVKRGFQKFDLSTICKAWKRYAASRPAPKLHQMRRVQNETYDEMERLVRSYIDLVDKNGNPVQPPIGRAMQAVDRILSICRQRETLNGMSVPVRDESGEKASGPIQIRVVYPEEMQSEAPKPETSPPMAAGPG